MAPPQASSSPLHDQLPQGAVDALADMLHHHEAHRELDVLTPAPLLQELVLLLDGVASGRRQVRDAAGNRLYEDDRKSLVCDLDLALLAVGACLNAFTTPTLRELRRQHVTTLGQTLDDPVACQASATVVRDILVQLRQRDAVKATWDDMLAAFVAPATPNATCALRAAQLAELVRLRGRDWSDIKSTLSLRVAKQGFEDAVELTMTEPLRDVEVAWVAFGNAHIRDGYLRVGQVQFFDNAFSLTDIRDGCEALD